VRGIPLQSTALKCGNAGEKEECKVIGAVSRLRVCPGSMSVLSTSAQHIYHSLLHLERTNPPDDSQPSVAAGKNAQAFVVAQRAAIVAALDSLDHASQTRVSSLCREVMAAPECSFVSVGQWGV